MVESPHPTAEKLLDTVSTMLDSDNPHDILVDEVLRISGVSRGSLYHHFGDFPGLVQATLLRRFSANVALDGQTMRGAAEKATSEDDYWERIRKLSAETQVQSRAPIRAERARIIGMASSDEVFGQALAREQEKVTKSMADAIGLAKDKGWVRADLPPRAIAVFLQAYSLGRAVDDIAESHVSQEDWILLVNTVIHSFRAR